MNVPRQATTPARFVRIDTRAARHAGALLHAVAGRRLNPFVWALRTLSSVRFAMLLLLVLAASVLTGTLIDQEPPTVSASPDAHQRWIDNARSTYGGATDLLDQLQLFNLFHSLFFRGLLLVLAVSILVCTARRWKPIWNTVFHTRVRVTETFVSHARFNTAAETNLPLEDAAARVRRALARAHYRVGLEAEGSTIVIFGDKHRLSRFGTFFTHLSLILILAGAIAGGVWGFKDPSFVVAEGVTRDLGLGTDISVRLDRSVNDYYPDGRPKNLQSDLTLFEHGKPVKQGAVFVNSPLRYRGIAFHESYFGQSAEMKVQDSSGREIFAEAVPLELRSSDGLRPVGRFELQEYGITVLLVGAEAGVPDPLVAPGEIRVDIYQDSVRAVRPQNLTQGKPAELIEGLTFTFERESLFAALQVVKDPGTIVIWIAGTLMVVGMVMLFYFPPRRLWVQCKQQPGGTTRVLIGMPAQRDVSLAREFERLAGVVTADLGAARESQQEEGHHV
jgi:cytochrome c biogenesis protein